MPISPLSSKEWQLLLADLVDQLGDEEFFTLLASASQFISGYQSTLIVSFKRQQRPVYIYDNLPGEYATASLMPYFEGSYLLDPFYSLFVNEAPEGIYRLQDLAPDNFYESEYYKSYYLQTGLTDESGLFLKISSDHYLLLSLGNRDTPRVKSSQLNNLQSILPILAALCRQHDSLSPDADGDKKPVTMAEPLDKAFRNFGKDHLSNRECEVVQLILKGHSNKSIARLLDLSLDTVKVYNKRFHVKLNVSSQSELFSLFLESISTAPIDSDIDPLTHYLKITSPDYLDR